jgi:tetratricopeptide (TPR) repeat protein
VNRSGSERQAEGNRSTGGDRSSPAGLATRLSRYEALIRGAAADGAQLENLVGERSALPRDAIDWYYRGVAFARLGRHDDAIDAWARAAELAPASTAEPDPAESSAEALREQDVDVGETSPAEGLPTPRDPVVTLVGTAPEDLARSEMFVAVNIEEPVPAGDTSQEPTPAGTAASPEAESPIPSAVGPGSPGSGADSGKRSGEAEDVSASTLGPAPPQRDGRDSSGWYYHAVTLARMRRFDEALQAYERAIECDESNTAAWHYMGITLARLGRHAEALAAYARAIELDWRDPTVWLNQAMSLAELGRHAQAEAAHEQALKLGVNPKQAPSPAGPRVAAMARAAKSQFRRRTPRRWR